MKWYTLIALTAGHVWFAAVVIRLYPLLKDARTMWLVLRFISYPASRLRLVLFYFLVPGLLNAIAMLWIYRLEALRPNSMAAMHDLTMTIASEFGPDDFPPELNWEEEAERTTQELAQVPSVDQAELFPDREPHPYFGALQSDTGGANDLKPL